MQLQQQLGIELALFLRDERTTEPVGRALFAAMCEVQEFFGGAGHRLQVPIGHSEHVADVVPAFRKTILAPGPLGVLPRPADREELGTAQYAEVCERLPSDTLGRVHHQELGGTLRAVLGSEEILVVVTDLEIAPPTNLRYLIWDVFFNGAVVSSAPTSPAYWGGLDTAHDDPVKAVKWRTRAACIAVVGSLLGMTRCDDDQCYLYENVDAVNRLDEMVYLGAEHAVEGLSGYGFPDVEPVPDKIAAVQPTANPMGSRIR